MKQENIKIGATQINNGFSGQYYLPYSIGLLYAFIKRNSNRSEIYEFNSKVLHMCILIVILLRL